MSWLGWFEFGGTEIINAQRTAAYAKHNGARWFNDVYKVTDLNLILEDPDYRSALQDDNVPWVDPNDPDTFNFYGVYPLGVDGLESSSRTSTITEYVGDGGNTGKLRHATKQIVFNTLLMGEDDAAVDAGMRWLRSALLNGTEVSCRSASCGGTDLCYYSAEPKFDPEVGADDCSDDLIRSLYRAQCISGPTINAKNRLSDGSEVWNVQFTIAAGIPWEFGVEREVIQDFLKRGVNLPNVAGGEFDMTGYISQEVVCKSPTYTPVFNPSCPDLLVPPEPVSVPIGCYSPPKNWRRRTFEIPDVLVPQWTDLVPLIQIHVETHSVTNMRVRIFVDRNGTLDPETDPCSFCCDMLISYIPPGGTLTIDGRDESITFISNGQERRADGLVYASNQRPFTWPQLSCGVRYLVTIDSLQTQVMPVIDFSVIPKAR